MARISCALLVAVTLVLLGSAAGRSLQEGTNSMSDRISQSMNAAHEAIQGAVSRGASSGSTRLAAAKNMAFAKTTTIQSADPWAFDGNKRKLLRGGETNSASDRIAQSMNAAHDVIENAVSRGAAGARVATAKNMAFAKTTTIKSADPWTFDGKRKLLAGGKTNGMSDRIAQSMNAAHDVIEGAVSRGAGAARIATAKNMAYAKTTTAHAADPWAFDNNNRRLLAGGETNGMSDRIAQSMNAAHDAINSAVGRGAAGARVATAKNMAFAKTTTIKSADPWAFDGNRKLLAGGETNGMSDRIAQSMNAAHDAINSAVGRGAAGARVATAKNMAFAKTTTIKSADPWAFDGNRKLLAGGETNSASDRIAQSMNAAHDAINSAVGRGAAGARVATAKNMAFAKTTTIKSADPWAFDGNKRKLLRGGETNSASDRISESMNAAQDVIERAVANGARGTRTAAAQSMNYAKLTTVKSVDPWQFSDNGN